MKKSRVDTDRIRKNRELYKILLFILLDCCVVFLSYFLGVLTQFGVVGYRYLIFIAVVVVAKILIHLCAGNYKTLTKNFGLVDTLRFALVVTMSNVLVCGVDKIFFLGIAPLSFATFALVNTFELVLTISIRGAERVLIFYSTTTRQAVPTMIIGAGSAGKVAFDEIHRNENYNNKIMCFVDDDVAKIGKKYLGKPVLGSTKNLHQIIEKYQIKEVVIAIANLDALKLKEIIKNLSQENVKIKRIPLLSEIDASSKIKIQDVSLAELLGREQVLFDTTEIKEFLHGKTVLITGGGGSIGSELSRQCYQFGVSKLILFDIYENAVYNIQQELMQKIKKDNSSIELVTLIGSTYNEFRVKEIFEKYRPEIVFHAAAYKHVPLMEDSPVEAIRTNCIGTYNVAKMCDKFKVKKMVLVSTDKAVRPTNTMGATKAFAEMIIRYWDDKSKDTSYSAVRFGNVLGSNGSVIPLFKSQIENGGPVTVTHKDIIRFFMTIPEAVSLILQSGAFATGGEIFILDMGSPVKILTLAENVIKQCGLVPYKDIDIEFTGLRPGEKLFEELLLDVTKNIKTSNNKIFIERKTKIQPMDEKVKFISKVFTMTDNDEIKNCLKEVVTNYVDYQEFNAKISSKK